FCNGDFDRSALSAVCFANKGNTPSLTGGGAREGGIFYMRFSTVILITLYCLTRVTACSTGVGKPANTNQEQNKTTATNSSNKEEQKDADINAIVRRLVDDKVVAFYKWDVDTDTTLFCIGRNTGKPELPGAPITTFSIIDQQGKLLYEEDRIEIKSISTSYILRTTRPQLVVDVNGGGKVNSLKILDYQQGKITELLDDEDQQYSISALIKPQFRSGVTPSQEPYEILLMSGVGLASPDEKYVNVYRYSDGSYEFKGKVPQKLLDNYLEQQLKKKAR